MSRSKKHSKVESQAHPANGQSEENSQGLADALTAPWLKNLKAYAVEDTGGMVKLDAMENPYPFPEPLQEKWLDKLKSAEINRYPDSNCTVLKDGIRQHLKLPTEAELLIGNGSDEIIHMLCLAFNRPGARMMSPVPSFAVYPLAAQAVNMGFIGVPLEPDSFELSIEIFISSIEEHQPSLIFLASPNNPTGNRFSDQDIRRICEASNGLVILDEAYWRFAMSNRIAELFDLDNIVFMHTLSKIGLAGIRLGALIGRRQWLEPLERVRMPYNVSSLSQVTGCFALEHDTYFNAQVERICASREKLLANLQAIKGLRVWPSETNFLLFRLDSDGGQDAPAVHKALKENGIAIKNLHGAHPALNNCLRVSVGTDDENGLFVETLQRVMV